MTTAGGQRGRGLGAVAPERGGHTHPTMQRCATVLLRLLAGLIFDRQGFFAVYHRWLFYGDSYGPAWPLHRLPTRRSGKERVEPDLFPRRSLSPSSSCRGSAPDTKQAIREAQAEVVPRRFPLKPVSAVPPMIRSPVHLGVLNKRMKEGARAEALSRGHTAERRLRDDDGRRPPSRRCLARPHHFAPASYQEGGDGTTPLEDFARIGVGRNGAGTRHGRGGNEATGWPHGW